MERSEEGLFAGLDASFSVSFSSGGAHSLDGVRDRPTLFSPPFRNRLGFGQGLSRGLVGA